MIDLRALNVYRDEEWEKAVSRGAPYPQRDCGCFVIKSPADGGDLRCQAARSGGPAGPWDHLSVSREDRIPTWDEMDYLARIFFRENEVAIQYHVPAAEHVNHHPNCLHLWGYNGLKRFPIPPSWMVGPDSAKGRR